MDSTELSGNFSIGDIVVYPPQGVGLIEKIEKRKDKEYIRIKINSSSMDVLLPLEGAEKLGLRHLASKEKTKSALDALSIVHVPISSDWKARLMENQLLLKSGDLCSIAIVVNNLYRRSKIKELPTLERKLYESALSMLVDESSSVLGISSEEVRKLIFSKLEA